MRTLCLTAVLLVASLSPAAPALGDKPPRWEYAELTFRTRAARPAGVDADGKEVAAVPATVSIVWITAAAEVDVKGWDELADKLKAPSLKKGTVAFQKMQILNFLGSEGWELMEQTVGSTAVGGLAGRGPGAGAVPEFARSPASSTWLLKRRLPQ